MTQHDAQCSRPAHISTLTLGDEKTAVIVPIMPVGESDIDSVTSRFPSGSVQHSSQLSSEGLLVPDLIEWRVDFYAGAPDPIACSHTAALLSARLAPALLATFRTKEQGGNRAISREEYGRLLLALAASGSIDALDVEWNMHRQAPEILAGIHHAGVPVVMSHHNFSHTDSPENIVELLNHMQDAGANVAKYACMPHSSSDVARLLLATAQAREELEIPIITMAMGSLGVASRVVGATFGSCATFARAGESSAPGQAPYEELIPTLETIASWRD